MLEKDKTQERVERHKITQEDFTPDVIVNIMLDKLPSDTFTDMNKTVLDPSCGIGNFLVEVLRRKLSNSKNEQEGLLAIRSIYGVEIMADNVEECRTRLYETFKEKYLKSLEDNVFNFKVRNSIRNRIVWYDSLKFNYKTGWGVDSTPREKHETVSFKEKNVGGHINYPMWGIKQLTKEDLDKMSKPLF